MAEDSAKVGLCWAGFWDDAGVWRCVLTEGHEGPHDYKKPSEFNAETKTLTIRHQNGDIATISADALDDQKR